MDNSIQQKNFEQLANATRYYRWLTDTMRPWLGRRILEIGCGQGNITVNFLDKERVIGIDFDEEYLHAIKHRFSSHKNFDAKKLDITRAEDLEALKAEKFDTVVGINVIEHIEDDVAAARHLYDILEPGGHVILLAPAFNALMSPFDKMVGHYRRYTTSSLQETVRAAGFKIQKAYYFNMLGALAWLIVFKWLKRTEAGTGNVAVLEALVPLLAFVERIIPAPFGLSVIVVGSKPLHD
jgi:2-polyprenyl-3-methyl-5-hydroxy-6-metoxy-1,4-benzoquinol methylase